MTKIDVPIETEATKIVKEMLLSIKKGRILKKMSMCKNKSRGELVED